MSQSLFSGRSPRFLSLDVFRGLAIAAMILVNNPGSWAHVYSPMRHAEWHGFTPTDLIFPAFLFIVGTAMAFSLKPPNRPQSIYSLSGRRFASLTVYLRILRRSLLLFALGLLLNGFYQYDWSTIRIMGVLQRISLAYFLAAAIVLHLSRHWQMLLAVAILLGYHSLLLYVPLPDGTASDLSNVGNWVGYIDRLVLSPEHILNGHPFDPEGLLSTLPATVTVLLGYWTGQSLRRQPRDWQTSFSLVAVGVVSLTAGKLWSLVLPLNKPLWTSSYVLYSAGWCWLLLAVLYATIELMGWRRWAFPFRVMGTNAIAIFVGSGLLARILLYTRVGVGESAISTQAWIYQQGFQSNLGDLNGSLAYAIAKLLFWWTIAFLLYQQRWFIKI